MNTENLSTLKIHKLTKEQYDREYAAGRIDGNAIYLTPDDNEDFDINLYATIEQLNTELSKKANTGHDHDSRYYTETEIDTKLSGKSNTNHNHDDKYDVTGAASAALASAKTYTDTALQTAKSYTDTKVNGLASTNYVDTAIENIAAITTAEIDAICGASIYAASEVEV